VAIGGQQLLGGNGLCVLTKGNAALHVVLAGGDRAGGLPKQPRVGVDGLLAATWCITWSSRLRGVVTNPKKSNKLRENQRK